MGVISGRLFIIPYLIGAVVFYGYNMQSSI
jgi:hypothetical protein